MRNSDVHDGGGGLAGEIAACVRPCPASEADEASKQLLAEQPHKDRHEAEPITGGPTSNDGTSEPAEEEAIAAASTKKSNTELFNSDRRRGELDECWQDEW